MRLLVVEDEERLADGLRAGLEAEGFAVDVAHDGPEGVWRARGSDDDRDDVQLSGEALDRASTAALEETGGGEVVDAEAEDEGETGYEVEVRLDDGTEVDVQLDDSFAVVSAADDEADDADDTDDANEADDRGEADEADEAPADQRQTTTTEARPGS